MLNDEYVDKTTSLYIHLFILDYTRRESNHDKDKEITYWVYFPMKQRKSLTKEIRHTNLADPGPPPPGCTLLRAECINRELFSCI